MNPLVAIRLECLRIAMQDRHGVGPDDAIKAAKAYEKHVRRGIRTADLGGACGCAKGAESQEAQGKRQKLLHELARNVVGLPLGAMTLAQLVTDRHLGLPQDDAERVDKELTRIGLRREVTGPELGEWVQTGKLPGAKGKGFMP